VGRAGAESGTVTEVEAHAATAAVCYLLALSPVKMTSQLGSSFSFASLMRGDAGGKPCGRQI